MVTLKFYAVKLHTTKFGFLCVRRTPASTSTSNTDVVPDVPAAEKRLDVRTILREPFMRV